MLPVSRNQDYAATFGAAKAVLEAIPGKEDLQEPEFMPGARRNSRSNMSRHL